MIDTRKLKGRIAMAGYSQARLARQTGMSLNSMNAKVNGRASFNCDEADKLCALLGIDSNDEKAEIFFPFSSQKRDDAV